MSFKKKNRNEDADLEEIRKGFEMFDVNGTGKNNSIRSKRSNGLNEHERKKPFYI